MTISVITPTYNRAYILRQCYESLCVQSVKDFEWVIVDDGSTDDTKALVEEFVNDNKICIKYIHQHNGGKHRAHNTAVKHSSGDLCVCLDSDDMLSDNAIEIAQKIWSENRMDKVIGILALRGDLRSHNPICSEIPKGLKCATMTELRDVFGFKGDTILFFKTEILKRNLFKEFEGETFLPEVNLYCDLDKLGKMILHNEVLYYCEYRSDGLTAKYHRLLFDNPKGSADTYFKMSDIASSFKMTVKYAIIAQSYNNLLDKDSKIPCHNKKIVMLLARIAALVFDYKYLRRFRR